jgi:hypothetical protein
LKSLYRSKVFWFNLLTLVVTVAEYFGFANFVPDDDTQAAFAGIVAIMNLVLRLVTNQGVRVK